MRTAKPKIASRFNRPEHKGLSGFSPTRTQQHFKNETDINAIVARAIRTGDTTAFTTTQRAQYYDTTAFSDYQSALDRIADVEEDFFTLPSAVRKEFGNDPENYVAFMSDPRNVSKAIELGLLEGGEKTVATPPVSAPLNPSGDPKPPVSEPPAAT
jgi:phage internal scaffolding protein